MTDRIDEDIVPIEQENDAYWAEIARLVEDEDYDWYDLGGDDYGMPPYDDTEDNLQPYVRRLWDAVDDQ